MFQKNWDGATKPFSEHVLGVKFKMSVYFRDVPIPASGIGLILSSSTCTCTHKTTPIPHNRYHVVKSSRSPQANG